MTIDPKRLEAAQNAFQRNHPRGSWESVDQQIEAAITAYLEAGDDWQPIETVPDHGKPIQVGGPGWVSEAVYDPKPECGFDWWIANPNDKRRFNAGSYMAPTHWQPRPQPPKQGE